MESKGDVARWFFTMHSIPFIDNRVPMQNWLSDSRFAKNTPFGDLPVLEVDGVTICQHRAIGRLLAKRLGYYGKGDIEQAKIDMIVDCISDIMDHCVVIHFYMEEGPQKQKDLSEFLNKTLPQGIENLSKLLDQNKQGMGFVGDSLTWADFEFASQFSWLEGFGHNANLSTKMKSLMNTVFNIPQIQEYCSKHTKHSY
ncbi:DgyrCDS8858 [Dimorphilus gyrociliatus]|uniref:glutathione transferase n=1 Tax=Dimorphilus gyrociliatus TaxID=2664684 RepID=A0A7I8VVM0_9ANNE|nr:DgyrCDS8858 [Dimorphilus gyrociliatus]